MAQYKSSFEKNKKGDKFVTYVVVGFAAVVMLLVGGIILGNILNPSLSYDDYNHLTNYNQITTMPEEEYIVYYYGINCSHCKTIKEDVLRFANSNDAGVKVYLMESSEASGYNNIVHPTTGSPMNGTPAMVVVIDGVVADLVSGSISIPELMDSINDGTYGLLNTN